MMRAAILGAIVLGVAGLAKMGNKLTGGKNELALEAKEVATPIVPLNVNAPSSPEKVNNKKKTIKVLSINSSRTLTVYGQVTQETEEVGRQVTALSKKSKEPIVILIDSPGGSILSGEKVVSAIEASRADVYTVCVGMCASMAAIIHAYGTKRLATDRAILMYHDASAMVGGRVGEMLSILNLIRRKLDKTNHYIANRSRLSYQELLSLGANNFWIDSEDAMEKGLVDGLVVIEE
jgi:ATP-dependent Clp protease, protease subunit